MLTQVRLGAWSSARIYSHLSLFLINEPFGQQTSIVKYHIFHFQAPGARCQTVSTRLNTDRCEGVV